MRIKRKWRLFVKFSIKEASFSTLRIDATETGMGMRNENADFFWLVVDNADNFFSFPTLFIFHTPQFPHSSFSIFRTRIPAKQKRNA